MRRLLLIFSLLALPCTYARGEFDHDHKAWSALLAKHVVVTRDGQASQVRYARMAAERAALKSYLDTLAGVTGREFQSWSKPQQLAFLINAYNAHMIELVLERYPDIKSVWDFGRVFNNPFRKRFFKLFGRDCSLDMIEHETIRAKGVYDDPRIHFAVNCASIGCPMLREEAYVGARLDAQLEEQTRRFLSDRSRNRYDPGADALEVSEVFKWYRDDFEAGYKGIRTREQFFAKYAALLADSPEQLRFIREQKAEIRYLDYDWALNDASGR